MKKDLKHIKPSLKGMQHTGYLGHFAQDKFIQQGHNDDGKVELRARDVLDALDSAGGDAAGSIRAMARNQVLDDLESDEKKMKSRNGDDTK